MSLNLYSFAKKPRPRLQPGAFFWARHFPEVTFLHECLTGIDLAQCTNSIYYVALNFCQTFYAKAQKNFTFASRNSK